jgi:hypothetical protein
MEHMPAVPESVKLHLSEYRYISADEAFLESTGFSECAFSGANGD